MFGYTGFLYLRNWVEIEVTIALKALKIGESFCDG